MTNALKRIPKWAWWVAGGVAIGGVALTIFRKREADALAEETGNPTADAVDQYGMTDGYYPGSTGGAPGVIVPPVIIPQDDNGGGASPFDPAEQFRTIIDGITTLVANGGSAPAPASQVPTPIVIQVPNTPVAAGAKPGAAKPCCTFNGKPLSWWQNPGPNKSAKGKWRWPDGAGFVHSERFRGNKGCDGGGSAGGSKRSC